MPFSHEGLTSDEEFEAEGAGIRLLDVARAVSVWAAMQDDEQTVASCAKAFNATADVICAAVRSTSYAAIRPEFETDPAKQVITYDGL